MSNNSRPRRSEGLFSEPEIAADAPLAERVRPSVFDALQGQQKIWAPGAPLRRLVEQGKLGSWIFWGPPGTGKTSLAGLIGQSCGHALVVMSAVHAGVKEIREQLTASAENIQRGGKPSLLFMDEIHRLSKSQQDVLLPALEQGMVKFIGATTENPSFEVNSAILSRSLVFRFEKIEDAALIEILRAALVSPTSALPRADVNEEVLHAIAQGGAGDARRSLNLLEALILSAPPHVSPIGLDELQHLGTNFSLRYDKKGDQHFDTISAFIKSIRANHPDAAIYYLARMIEAGEDPMFIARRLVIAASEDIGNANPTALLVATSGMQAVHLLGYPEARIVLAQVTTYLASSPKSNRSYVAIDAALADVRETGPLEIPLHLRNAPTQMMKEFGYGKDYAYAHDDLENARKRQYLPDALRGKRYFVPGNSAVEIQLQKYLEKTQPFNN